MSLSYRANWSMLSCRTTIRTAWLACACGLLVLSACGYNLQGRGGSTLPENVKRIHVPIFSNNTLEQGIGVRVTDSIRKVILNDGRVVLAGGLQDADAVLVGQVLQFRLRAIGFNSEDRAQEVRLRMSMRVVLRDLERDRILFRQTIVSDREYQVSSDLQTNQSKKARASQLASDDIAQELQSLMIEGF